MGTAIKHPVPERVKPSFVIFDIRALWRSRLSVRVPGCHGILLSVVRLTCFICGTLIRWRCRYFLKRSYFNVTLLPVKLFTYLCCFKNNEITSVFLLCGVELLDEKQLQLGNNRRSMERTYCGLFLCRLVALMPQCCVRLSSVCL